MLAVEEPRLSRVLGCSLHSFAQGLRPHKEHPHLIRRGDVAQLLEESHGSASCLDGSLGPSQHQLPSSAKAQGAGLSAGLLGGHFPTASCELLCRLCHGLEVATATAGLDQDFQRGGLGQDPLLPMKTTCGVERCPGSFLGLLEVRGGQQCCGALPAALTVTKVILPLAQVLQVFRSHSQSLPVVAQSDVSIDFQSTGESLPWRFTKGSTKCLQDLRLLCHLQGCKGATPPFTQFLAGRQVECSCLIPRHMILIWDCSGVIHLLLRSLQGHFRLRTEPEVVHGPVEGIRHRLRGILHEGSPKPELDGWRFSLHGALQRSSLIIAIASKSRRRPRRFDGHFL
mmetsp:Transcript_40652/g.63870  ORF Transcript_40652/g.63870 Transcript_40652/m.63870 type:complete len:341 (+) Transcript_40652:107-1129(+)